MEKIKCACGRSMAKYFFNSTIKRKQCPNCELKNKLSGDDKAVKKGIQRKERKWKKSEKSKAMDRADEWFSKYIRLKHSFESGGERWCRCYTCGNIKHIKVAENGHWQRRGYKTTRYHLNDCRPQCFKCNNIYQGKPEIFEIKLRKEVGDAEVDMIKALAQAHGEDNEIFFREQATKYRKMFNLLLLEFEIKNPWKK